MSYSTILLDLDNTILSFDEAEKYALRKLLMDQKIDWQEDLFAFYHQKNKALWSALEQGKVSRSYVLSERFVALFKQVDCVVEGDKMDERFRNYLSEEIFFIPDALDVLLELSKNHQLYIVTNGVAITQKKRIEKAGIGHYFEKLFISEEIGHQKPSQAFFSHVLDNIEEKKELTKILMVGDSLSADILGGNQAGLDTCWYSQESSDVSIQPTYQIKSLTELLTITKQKRQAL